MNQLLPTVAMADYGKDHWSLLAYLETVVTDHKGQVDFVRLRCNPARHPHQVGHRSASYHWSVAHGTRLKGFFRTQGQPDLERQLTQHDDFDCMVDLEEGGLIIATGLFDSVVLTPLGREVANKLREHKAAGNEFATFEAPTALLKS